MQALCTRRGAGEELELTVAAEGHRSPPALRVDPGAVDTDAPLRLRLGGDSGRETGSPAPSVLGVRCHVTRHRPTPPELGEEVREQLRAMGYVAEPDR